MNTVFRSGIDYGVWVNMASIFRKTVGADGALRDHEGLPLPPANLRMNSKAEQNDEVYAQSATRLVRAVRAMLESDRFSKHKRGFKNLKEAEILDLGCGTARFLHGLVSNDAMPRKYVGVDVQARQINWCRDHLSNKGNFHFQHIDVQNDRYNPKGKQTIHDQIDANHRNASFVMIRSVFTHMRTMEALRTLHEARTIVQDKGRVYLTVNVKNNTMPWTDTPDGMANGQNLLKVEFNKGYFENMIEEAGFQVSVFAKSVENQCVYFLRPV